MVIAALDRVRVPNILLHVYTAQPKEYLQLLGIGGSRLVHHPHAPSDEVERIQRAADILLVPFDFESPAAEVIRTAAPGKLGDYLSSGTPILAVVPPDSFVAWYLRQYECGFIVDKADVVTVAEAIRRLLRDSELRAKLVANAAARARIDFDPTRAQQSMLRALGAAP
jgi:glycosyltransferase involved in cell wall biosynthesis